MKKLFSYLSIALFVVCLLGVPAMACPDNPCDGGNCHASGNFDISTFAAGGGVDCALETIPNGVAGGIGAAGGVSLGEASGSFESYKKPVYEWKKVCRCGRCRWERRLVGYKTVTLGNAGADLNSVAGGFVNTNDYVMHDCGLFIGVGSQTDTFATTRGSLHVEAEGLAEAHGFIGGIAGQGSLNGSLIGPSPLCCWDSEGFSAGLAGQGSIGGFAGGAVAGLYGEADIEAGIDMFGNSYSESYRGITFDGDFKTEYMGTNVGASTEVTSYKAVDTSCLATGCIDGGFMAGGFAGALTVQKTDSGIAKASALGMYSGGGSLGCNFSGSAAGYTHTSATTLQGYSGSVMSSSAGMQVSSNPVGQID